MSYLTTATNNFDGTMYQFPDGSEVVASSYSHGRWIAIRSHGGKLINTNAPDYLFDSAELAAEALSRAGEGPGRKPPEPKLSFGRCGECKFWGRHLKGDEDQSGEFRQCGRATHDKKGHCKSDEELQNLCGDQEDIDATLAQPIRKELAVVQDSSGYFAALKTRDSFGCILFEQEKS